MMKKHVLLVVSVLASLGMVGVVYASSTYSQTINLAPGWNAISAPRVVASHVFSAAETSTNFDIYVLDATKPSGWATMDAIGQTEFTPLYGYFINNKTGADQTLVLNYKDGLTPSERLFQRTFSQPGWYSIGTANPTYSIPQCSGAVTESNTSGVLGALSGGISSLLDFTSSNYLVHPTSVAVGSSWVDVLAGTSPGLRDTKGYGIYVTGGVQYAGYQNSDDPNTCTPVTVTSVGSLDDINVFIGSSPNLPTSVVANLSDGTTQSLAVTWDGGSPTYDSGTSGTYAFVGTLTLPDYVSNPSNVSAHVNVAVVPVGSIAVSKDPAYADQNVIVPQNNFEIGQWNVTAGPTEGVNIDTLTFDITPVSGTTFSAANLTDVYLVVGGVSTSPKATVNPTNNTFSVSTAMTPNQVISVKMYADIGPTVTPNDSIKVTLSVSGTTALSGQTISQNGIDGQVITATSGTFTATLDGSSPISQNIYDNQAVTAAAYKLTATNNSYKVKQVMVTIPDATGISSVDLMDGSTVVSTQPATTTVTFNIPTVGQPLVAAGTTKVLTVRLNLGTIGTPGGGASAANHTVTLVSYQVIDSPSGTTHNSGDSAAYTLTNGTAKTLIAYASTPTVALQALPSTVLSAGTKTLAKFTISSNGGSIGWKAIMFDVASSSHVTGLTGAKLYDSSNTEVQGGFFTTASVSLAGVLHGRVVFVANNEQLISGSQTYSLKANVAVSGLTAGDNVTVTIPAIASAAISTTYDGGLASDLSQQSFIWSDESSVSPPHSTATADWHNDYLVQYLPTDSQSIYY